jgi:hypothetical protein
MPLLMPTDLPADEAVAIGAALLDTVRPDWASELDLETFDIGSTRCCIIGQLYSSYNYGLAQLVPLTDDNYSAFVLLGRTFGFCGMDYDVLQHAWFRAIAARRHAPITRWNVFDGIDCYRHDQRIEVCLSDEDEGMAAVMADAL